MSERGIPETLTATRLRQLADWIDLVAEEREDLGIAVYSDDEVQRDLRGWADWLDAQPDDGYEPLDASDYASQQIALDALDAQPADRDALRGGSPRLRKGGVAGRGSVPKLPPLPAVSGRVTPTRDAFEKALADALEGWDELSVGPISATYAAEVLTEILAKDGFVSARVTPTREDAAQTINHAYTGRWTMAAGKASPYAQEAVDALVAAEYLDLES